MLVTKWLLFIWLTLLTLTSVQARGWQGIVQMHSTRADVHRIMGVPTETPSQYTDFYRTSKETVLITYAKGLPCGIGEKYSQWRVRKDTVESILVTPTESVSISDLAIDEAKYEKHQGGHRREDVYYVNKQTGETIVVWLNEVKSLTYSPGTLDKDLQCPGVSTSSNIECDRAAPPRFSFYRNVSFERERGLLDNFGIALNEQPERMGYIIAYAGKRARVGEARARAKRAKEYLERVRAFGPERLKAIDGGYREEAETDLFLVSGDLCPPIAVPTIDPREVKIMKTPMSGHRRG